MRKQTALILLAAVALAGAGCKRRDRTRIAQTEEEAPQLAATVHMSDAASAAQLVSGFYGVEQNAWRWTAGKFAVVLRPPRNSAQKGAVLRLKFVVPDAVIQKLQRVSLAAMAGGTALPAETYSQAGEYVYERDVPAAALARDSVKIDFYLDKFLPSGAVDARELGVIATSIGLETK
jgi:hypothetical protein